MTYQPHQSEDASLKPVGATNMTDKTDPRAGMVHVEVTPAPQAARPAEQHWVQLAEQHKGRADDCGALARAVLAARPAAPQANLAQSHGHVTPRPDGVKARCGGPAMCKVCQAEKAALSQAAPAQPDPMTKGWLAALSDARYAARGNDWLVGKLAEIHVHLAAPAQPAQPDDGDLLDLASLDGIVPLTVSAGDLDGEAQPAQQPEPRDEALRVAREALANLAHYGKCQVTAFSSGRPYLDLTLFPRLCAEADSAIARIDALGGQHG